MYNPIRVGSRGGRDQFEWKQVKEDKYRENYLGNSFMAPVGRWQNNKDLTWYSKKTNERTDLSDLAKLGPADKLKDELAAVKAQEQAFLQNALVYGLGSAADGISGSGGSLSESELKKLITSKLASSDLDDVDSVQDASLHHLLSESNDKFGLGYNGLTRPSSNKRPLSPAFLKSGSQAGHQNAPNIPLVAHKGQKKIPRSVAVKEDNIINERIAEMLQSNIELVSKSVLSNTSQNPPYRRHRKESYQSRHEPSEYRYESSRHRSSRHRSPNHRETSPHHRETSPHHRETSPHHKSSYHRSPPHYKKSHHRSSRHRASPHHRISS